MNPLHGKLNSLYKLLVKNKNTKPRTLGKNILLLATAPCAADFFDFSSVREQFKEYDLAIINFMLIYSEEEVFKYKPKYVILMDPIFYQDDYFGESTRNKHKEAVVRIMERVDWPCFLVTSVLADFGIKNDNVGYIRLSCFSAAYKKGLKFFFEKNWINFGVNNVIHAAIYFAITFGYKKIAILGCTYKNLQFYMDIDGIHILEHNHYYDLDREEEFISNEELSRRKVGFCTTLYYRAYISSRIFWDLKAYAECKGVEMINYSEGSMIDAIKMGSLDKSNE